MAINDDLANATLRNAHRIVAFEKTINREIQGNLIQLERELARILTDEDLAAALPRFQEQRLQRLRRDVNEAIDDTYRGNTSDLQAGLHSIAQQTQRLTVGSFAKIFTYDILNVTLTAGELRALSQNPVVLGGKVTENWFKQKTSLKQKFVEQMRLGLAQGETNEQLATRLIGKRTGAKQTVTIDGKAKSVPVRSGGVMDVSRRDATALVRTSAQSVSNTTLESLYQANTDIISGVAVLVTLDGRTTRICMSLSGGEWNIRTGDPLPTSANQIPYPGPPPYHWQALAGDTMVETIDGLRRIDEIEPGDMVMTGKGRFRPCYAVHRKLHEGKILEVGFDSGSKLTITDDHPLPIAGRGYQAARELKVGDQCFQYAERIEAEFNRTPPCGVADCSPALLVEELVSDEVRCLPVFRNLTIDLEHHPSGEGKVDDVPALAELEQVVVEPDSREDRQEAAFAVRRMAGEVPRPLDHCIVNSGPVAHGIAGAHALGDLSEPWVSPFCEPVSPSFGRVVHAGGGRQGGAFALASCADALPEAVVGEQPVGEGEIAFDGAERFAAIDVAALDQLVKEIVAVPGCGFRHTVCTSTVERQWEGPVYNLSVVGDETYVANGVLVHNCRTIMAPVTKSWADLGVKKRAEIMANAKRPQSVRASVNGEAPGRQTYEEFLRGQSDAFQNNVLGKGRAELFRKGDLKLNQLTDATLRPLTLAQLEKVTG